MERLHSVPLRFAEKFVFSGTVAFHFPTSSILALVGLWHIPDTIDQVGVALEKRFQSPLRWMTYIVVFAVQTCFTAYGTDKVDHVMEEISGYLLKCVGVSVMMERVVCAVIRTVQLLANMRRWEFPSFTKDSHELREARASGESPGRCPSLLMAFLG
jgi:hypothetical protein